MFSCSQNQMHKSTEIPMLTKNNLISKIISLKNKNVKPPEFSSFEGEVDIVSNVDGKIYSFKEAHNLNPYLYINTTIDDKFISAVLFSTDKKVILENEIRDVIRAEDWNIKTSFVSQDDATEKTIVFSVKENASYGYYKGMENNKIHFLEVGSERKPFLIKDLCLY